MTAAVGIEVPAAVARLVAGARTGGGGALVVRGGSEQARVAVLTAAWAAAGDVLDLRTTGVGRSPGCAAPACTGCCARWRPGSAPCRRRRRPSWRGCSAGPPAGWTGWCSAPRCSTC